jgi:3'-phosphoadenosine 5'-phosphosulfate sulfotransferase (PAPS reductase)/FAD synthetase
MNERHQKLLQMQALPLAEKIEASKRRIREWLDRFPDARVAFSGGKDSTVLLDLCRQVSPGILASFANTGLEYPEIVEFVRQTPNVLEVRPKMDFLSVIQKYGYPVVSKRVAQYVKEVQRSRGDTATKHLRLTGVRGDGSKSPMGKISGKWQFLCSPGAVRVSDVCCKILKKNPQDALGTAPIIGTMASDSGQRAEQYYRHGCNAFDLARARSAPLSFWTEVDVWEYLRTRNLPYSRIYDMGYHRTGCMFCMFGLHMEKRPNRFDLMFLTHPQLYKYCMDGPLNLRSVIREVYGMEMPVLEKRVKSVLD